MEVAPWSGEITWSVAPWGGWTFRGESDSVIIVRTEQQHTNCAALIDLCSPFVLLRVFQLLCSRVCCRARCAAALLRAFSPGTRR